MTNDGNLSLLSIVCCLFSKAANGNRTRVTGLGSRSSTPELWPQGTEQY